jgi:hypothetical protein
MRALAAVLLLAMACTGTPVDPPACDDADDACGRLAVRWDLGGVSCAEVGGGIEVRLMTDESTRTVIMPARCEAGVVVSPPLPLHTYVAEVQARDALGEVVGWGLEGVTLGDAEGITEVRVRVELAFPPAELCAAVPPSFPLPEPLVPPVAWTSDEGTFFVEAVLDDAARLQLQLRPGRGVFASGGPAMLIQAGAYELVGEELLEHCGACVVLALQEGGGFDRSFIALGGRLVVHEPIAPGARLALTLEGVDLRELEVTPDGMSWPSGPCSTRLERLELSGVVE